MEFFSVVMALCIALTIMTLVGGAIHIIIDDSDKANVGLCGFVLLAWLALSYAIYIV